MRKPARASCLNLVQKTGQAEEPREYILIRLTSNHAQWDSQWFYLCNDDDLFPAYTRWLVSERAENWNYGVTRPFSPSSDPSSMP